MTKSTTQSNLIVIAPEHTKINDNIELFDNIAIVLENGKSYTIAETVHLLEQHDKKSHKKQHPGKIRRMGRAFKAAFKETVNEEDGMAVRTPK